MQRHDGHQVLARRDVIAKRYAALGDMAINRRHDFGIAEIDLSGGDLRLQGLDLGPGSFHLGTGSTHLGGGRRHLGACVAVCGQSLIHLLLGHRLRIGFLQSLVARQITGGVLCLGLGTPLTGQNRGLVGKGLLILCLRLHTLRLDLGQTCLRIGGIDFGQNLSAMHQLVVGHIDGNDLSGNLRRDMDDMGVNEGIVRVFILAGIQPPDDAGHDQ